MAKPDPQTAKKEQQKKTRRWVITIFLATIAISAAISLAERGQELKALEGPIFLVGDGSSLTYNTLSGEIPGLVLPPEHRMHQRATGVALLAVKKQAAGEAGDGNALIPNYLRLSQAERERLEKA